METKKPRWEPTQLELDIRGLRNEAVTMKYLFEKLEGKCFTDCELPEGTSISEYAFYHKYVLFVIKECHLDAEKEDCILAAFGLLAGYEIEGVKRRHELYCENIGIFNNKTRQDELLSNYWGKNIDKSLNDKENRIIRGLAQTIQKKLGKDYQKGGKLGYTDDEEVVSRIIQVISPEPHYLRGEGYRKCEAKGKIFYVPLTEVERKQQANVPIADHETKSDELIDAKNVAGIATPEKLEEGPGDTSTTGADNTDPADPNQKADRAPTPGPEPEPEPEPEPRPEPPKLNKNKPYIWKRWIYRAIIAVVVIGLGWFAVSKYTLTHNLPDAPPGNIENDVSSSSVGDNTESNPDAEKGLIPVSLTEDQRSVKDEDVARLIEDAQSSIAIYDESGAYDIESIRLRILERIESNPIYGDMVARGIFEADSAADGKIQEYNPHLADFIEKTNAVFETPELYQEGLQRWLIRTYTVISPTDEYKEYARYICSALSNFLWEDEILELKFTSRWYVDSNENGIYTRAVKSSEKDSQPAFVFVRRSGDTGLLIGFLIDDGSVVICNPWELDLESFVG